MKSTRQNHYRIIKTLSNGWHDQVEEVFKILKEAMTNTQLWTCTIFRIPLCHKALKIMSNSTSLITLPYHWAEVTDPSTLNFFI